MAAALPNIYCHVCNAPSPFGSTHCIACKQAMPKQSGRLAAKAGASEAKFAAKLDDGDPALATLMAKVQKELDSTHATWAGKAVKVKVSDYQATEAARAAVQPIGAAHGCHTCLVKIAVDRTQPWTGDHIPPTNLHDFYKTSIGLLGTAVRLFPQCNACERKQATLVHQLNHAANVNAAFAALNAAQVALLKGTKAATAANSIASGSDKVSSAESAAIQLLGARDGCHQCATAFPASYYHADHCPPVELSLPRWRIALAAMGVAADGMEVRPQCPKCSHQQGGHVGSLQANMLKIKALMGDNS
jgi:hypothetical protein